MKRCEDAVCGETGQTVVYVTVFIAVLFGFCAVVIDGGNFLLTRRNLQGNADAAALAGAQEIVAGGAAEVAATDYVENQNADDNASVDDIDVDGGTVAVTVNKEEPGWFLGFFGMSAPTIRASATAQVNTMGAASGMLPMALMKDSYALGENVDVKFDGNATGNRGVIAPDIGPPECPDANGASDMEDMILTGSFGGVDACAHEIGDESVFTETGNMAGPARHGFDTRIGDNTDSFEDVFEFDAATGRYMVAKPDSPRFAIVPVIENLDGTSEWPSGSKEIRILRYICVYIGKTDESPDYPAYTNNGKNVWITPVNAILPDDFDNTDDYMEWDEASDAPAVIRLIS